MPMFEFRCRKCNHIFEEFVFSSNKSTEDLKCPNCRTENPEKLMSAFSSAGGGLQGSSSYSSGSSCGSGGFT